jgi:hypothetical protein
MRADGEQLGRITSLIEDSAVSVVVDKAFPFDRLNDAMPYVDTGRAPRARWS